MWAQMHKERNFALLFFEMRSTLKRVITNIFLMSMSETVSLNSAAQWAVGVLRVLLGWIFFWPFLDKLFGLGFSTAADKGWLDGVSPTFGYLKFGTEGPFAEMFQSMAESAVVEWLFMVGLLLIGLALILGIGIRVAVVSGSLMLLMMYLATFPPEHNPFLDEHIIYAVGLFLVAALNGGRILGLGKWWGSLAVVQRNPWLK